LQHTHDKEPKTGSLSCESLRADNGQNGDFPDT